MTEGARQIELMEELLVLYRELVSRHVAVQVVPDMVVECIWVSCSCGEVLSVTNDDVKGQFEDHVARTGDTSRADSAHE